jgi:hypothetical protein
VHEFWNKFAAWHGWGGKLPAFQLGDTCAIPRHYVWCYWCSKWQRGRFLVWVLRFFLSLSFHVHALIYHRSYKIFKIDSTLWITHFLHRSRKYFIHKPQATKSFPLHDLDFESDSLLMAQQTQEMPTEYLSISYVIYQVIRKNCAIWIQIGYLTRIKAGITFVTLFDFTL